MEWGSSYVFLNTVHKCVNFYVNHDCKWPAWWHALPWVHYFCNSVIPVYSICGNNYSFRQTKFMVGVHIISLLPHRHCIMYIEWYLFFPFSFPNTHSDTLIQYICIRMAVGCVAFVSVDCLGPQGVTVCQQFLCATLSPLQVRGSLFQRILGSEPCYILDRIIDLALHTNFWNLASMFTTIRNKIRLL